MSLCRIRAHITYSLSTVIRYFRGTESSPSAFIENVLQALIADGHDPEEYIFDIDTSDKKTSRTSKSK